LQLNMNNKVAEVNFDPKHNAFVRNNETGKIILLSSEDAAKLRAGTPLSQLAHGGRGLLNEP
jgi:hypothetical protein